MDLERVREGNMFDQAKALPTFKRKHIFLSIHSKHVLDSTTWSWFIWPMATLGLSVLMHVLPYRFNGLTTLGIIVYLFGVAQWIVLLFSRIIYFAYHRKSLRKSIQQSSETLFFSTVLLGWAALLLGMFGPPQGLLPKNFFSYIAAC